MFEVNRKMCKRRPATILFAALVVLLSATGSTRAQTTTAASFTEEFHQTYALAPNGRVSLANIDGDVRVKAWDQDEVRVDAVKRAYAPERLREAEIKVDTSREYLRIQTEYTDWPHRGPSEEPDRRNQPASIEYTLMVPRNARLDEVGVVSGALNIDGMTGSVRASAVNGNVVARGLRGAVKLSVINGRLEAAFDRISEGVPVTLSAVSGPLLLTIPSDSNALLKASTVHGTIVNDFNLPVRAGRYVGRDLEGQLGNGGGTRIKLTNVSGQVSIRRAADNRPLSRVTNLLSESRAESRPSDGPEEPDMVGDAAAEARREIDKEMAKAAERARLEAGRLTLEQQREIRREAQRQAQEQLHQMQRDGQVRRETLRNKDVVKDKDKDKAIGPNNPRRVIDRESNTFQASGTPRVRLETFDGDIAVHAWDKQEVMYSAVKRAADANELKGIRLHTSGRNDQRTERNDSGATSTTASSEIIIRAEFDKAFALNMVEREGRVVLFNSGASVDLDVYVPRNAVLVVSSGDGRLRIEGVNGQLELRTGDGSIDVSAARGRLRAETGDGRIRLEGFDGVAETRTGVGRIALDGRFTQLSARTGDGTILLSIPEDLNATIETNAESVVNDGVAVAEDNDAEKRVRRWRVGNGGQLFSLQSGDGQIILRRR